MNFIPYIEGKTALSITLSTSAASSDDLLEVGTYAIWSDTDSRIKLATTAAVAETVTAADGFLVDGATKPELFKVVRPNYLGAIAGEAGTLYYHKCD